jgi:hypothetical protein
MFRIILITVLVFVSLSCSQPSQQEVKAVDGSDQSKRAESEDLSWEERCKVVTSKSEPQVSSSSAGTSKPLKDAKPVERTDVEVKEVPNRFPTPEEIQKCRKPKTVQDDN